MFMLAVYAAQTGVTGMDVTGMLTSQCFRVERLTKCLHIIAVSTGGDTEL